MKQLRKRRLELRMITILMVTVFGVMFAGSAASQTSEFKKSGFLSDYSLLKEQTDPKWSGDWLYIKEGVDWKSYDRVIIDQVTYFFKESGYNGVSASELAILATYFGEALVKTLLRDYAITDKPGPRTLRIRFAVVDLKPNKPVAGTLTTIMPMGLALSHIKKATTGTHIGMGGISGEMEILDSQTGETLVAAIDEATGQKHLVKQSFTTWGQVEKIMDQWATDLLLHLEHIRMQ